MLFASENEFLLRRHLPSLSLSSPEAKFCKSQSNPFKSRSAAKYRNQENEKIIGVRWHRCVIGTINHDTAETSVLPAERKLPATSLNFPPRPTSDGRYFLRSFTAAGCYTRALTKSDLETRPAVSLKLGIPASSRDLFRGIAIFFFFSKDRDAKRFPRV